MFGHSSRVFLEVVMATLLGLVVLGAAAAWRLSQGPVSLTFLTPYIEEALNQQGAGLKFTIGDTNLTWAGRERNLDILAIDVKARAPDGRVVASVPRISINFSTRGLLQGVVAPTTLELIGPRLLLARTRSRGFELAFEDSGTLSEEQTRALFRDLLPASTTTSALRYLKRISVVDAKLTVDDRLTGTIWGAPRASAVLWRDGNDLRAEIDIDIDMGGERLSRLRGDAVFREDEKKIRADIRFTDLRVDLVAKKLSPLKRLESLLLSVDGRAVLELDETGRLLAADFDITGENGRLAPSALLPDGLAFKALTLRGRLQRSPAFVVFDEVKLDLDGPTVVTNAVITRIGDNAAINAHAVLRDMPIDSLKRYWPESMAPIPRKWVIGNIKGGMISKARLEVSARTGIDGEGGVDLDSLTGTFQFAGGAVHYMRPLPPVRNVTGTAKFDRERFVFTIKEGESEGIRVESAIVRLTRLDTDNEHAQIELVLRGRLQSALELIDHPELKLAGKVGIDSGATTGEMATRLVLTFPLRRDLRFQQISIGAAANLRSVVIPGFIRGMDISDGDLMLRVDKTGLDVKGSAKLGPAAVEIEWYQDFSDTAKIRRRYRIKGVLGKAEQSALGLAFPPYQRGPVEIDLALLENALGKSEVAVKLDLKQTALAIPFLGWSKAPGAEGIAWLTMRLAKGGELEGVDFDIRTTGLRSSGNFRPASGDNPLRVTLHKFTVGATDVSGTISGRADGGFDIRLAGSGFDAAPLLRDDDTAPAGDLPPLRVTAKLDRLWFSTGPPVGDVAGTLIYDGETWSDIDAEGTLGKNQRMAISVRTDGAVRKMTVRSTNAGGALRTLGLFDTMADGEMVLDGERDGSKPGAPWRGRLVITDFRIVDVPMLAQILSLGSLTGIADALGGKGIAFARLDIPYELKDKVLTITKARSVGAALGLTAYGEIDFVRERLKLNGTLVPANTLNSLLGNIPLVGTILTGREGIGIFAMNYGIEGPLSKPTITVNPLTALAPGFLRDLIGLITGTGPKLPPGKPSDEIPSDE